MLAMRAPPWWYQKYSPSEINKLPTPKPVTTAAAVDIFLAFSISPLLESLDEIAERTIETNKSTIATQITTIIGTFISCLEEK